tara:strand:- start:354 stop:1316 length:963 start_codon:yes stop_codon:yes gene_type:complete
MYKYPKTFVSTINMRLSSKFLVIIVSLSIISYGITDLAYGQTNVAPINVQTDHASYGTGETINVSGFVKDFDGDADVTLMIIDPRGNIVTVAQIAPNSDGNYSHTIKAAGMISVEGEYTIRVQIQNNGPQKNNTVFEFVGGPGSQVVAAPPQETELEAAVESTMEPEPEPVMETTEPVCGQGTVLKDGLCVVEEKKKGGGCLIATAAFGSEMAPQVQFLREIRDNTVLQTESGSAFMMAFNQFYYSFSPTIADYERENPVFKETVKLALTPMLTSLTILNYVDIDSEQEMLGYGIGIILLNIGMYFVAPAVIIFKIKNRK